MIFSVNTLHHFSDPAKVLGELLRVLKPGGRLILSDFTEKGFKFMDRIHALDGNTHSRGEMTVSQAGVYLRKKKCSINSSATAFHQTLLAEKRR